ncbi:MAG: M23 family metallopeptidase [Mesorhizobium sp.]|nr:M23 family metallopeptidase [Mesorhizobium sp.]MCO5162298.1 M23 family metallopeptidase [Mesorhizobium sp.]
MPYVEDTIEALGNEPPLIADGRGGPPDRREVSARWLSGTFLTGLTSTVLMGVALLAALDGREQLATPPEIATVGRSDSDGQAGEAAKTSRLVVARSAPKARDRRRMEVSMMTKVGDRNVVRTMPFVQVKMDLAAGHTTSRSYPPFDPLDVFADDDAPEASAAEAPGVIYGAKVESEVSLRTLDFPVETASFDEKSALSANEIEEVVRETGLALSDGAVQVAALHYVDPERFGQSLAGPGLAQIARVLDENRSKAMRGPMDGVSRGFSEDYVPIRSETSIQDAFKQAGYDPAMSQGIAAALESRLGGPMIKEGWVLRIGVESTGTSNEIVRCSLYRGTDHIVSIAVDDRDRFVVADEPEKTAELAAAFDDSPAPRPARADLPSVYDGIYRAAYSYGMSRPMTQQLVRLLASDVDFQTRLNPSDRIVAFFSQPEEDDTASEESELLYVNATFNGNTRTLYRFQMEDGSVDYFDGDGRSARQFLLRNPVPNGRFRSGFGARRHPILGYVRMHTGVDWSAPRGTPIIAAGNGVIEKAGWTGGYGRQTIVRHANGYETSYSHQSGLAKGVAPGARVRQGQVIGYVGSTGLSTGNHLHYELIVNGNKVDPMRVRLPVGKVLKGDELEAFKKEKERVDALLREEGDDPLKVAQAAAAQAK